MRHDQGDKAFLTQHLGLVVSLLTLFMVAIRVLMVARRDVQTALALLQASGPVEVFLGAALGSFSLTLLYCYAVALLFVGLNKPPQEIVRSTPVYMLGAAVGVLLFALAPWPVFLVFVGTFVAIPIIALFSKKQTSNLDRVIGAGGAILLTLVLFLITDEPWTPLERIERVDEVPVIGHVVQESSDWITVLRGEDRTILRIPAGLIESRQLCSSEGDGIRTWSSALDIASRTGGNDVHEPRYASCEET